MCPSADVADDARRGFEPVEFGTRIGVTDFQVAFQSAVDDYVTRCGDQAAPQGERFADIPRDVAGGRIPRRERTHVGAIVLLASLDIMPRREDVQGRADVGLACGVLNLERLVGHAGVVAGDVDQLSLRRVGYRRLVLRSHGRGADQVIIGRAGLAIGTCTLGLVFTARLGGVLRIDCRNAGLRIDTGGPVGGLVKLLGNQQFASFAV